MTTTPGPMPTGKAGKTPRKAPNRGATARTNPASPSAIERQEKAEAGLEMRNQGATWQQVANAHYGGATSTAYDAVTKLLRDRPVELVEVARAQAAERYLYIMRQMAPLIEARDRHSPAAANSYIRAQRSLEGILGIKPEPAREGESELDQALRELDKEMRLRALLDGSPPVPVE